MADEFIYNSMELFDEFINFPIDETDPVIPNPFIYNEEPSIGDEIFGLLPDGIGAVIPDPPTYNEGPSIDDTKIEEGGDAKETGRKQAEESAESALKDIPQQGNNQGQQSYNQVDQPEPLDMSMGAGDNRSNPVEQDFHRIDSQQAGNSGDMPLLAQDPGTMSSAGASVTMAPAAVEALVSSRNIIPSDMRHSNSPSTTNKNDFKGDKTKNEQNKKGARRPAAAARKPRASQPKNSGLQKKKANLQRDARSKQIEAHNGLQTRGMLESGLSQQISDVALDQNMLERRGAFNAMIAYQEHPGHFNDQNQALGPQSHHLSSHMGHMGHMGNMNQIQQNLPVPNSFPQMGQMKEMQQFYTVSASFPEMNQMNNIQHNSAVSAPFPQMDYNMTAPPLRSYNNMGNGTGEFQGNLLPPRTNHDNPANQQFAMIENSFQSMAMTWNDSNTATLGQISFLNESNPPSFPEQNPGAPQVGRVLHGQATLQFQQPQSQLPQLQPLAAHMFQSEDNQQTNINNATSAIANREINNGQPSQPVVSTPSTNGVPPVEPKESLTFFRKWMLAHYVGGK